MLIFKQTLEDATQLEKQYYDEVELRFGKAFECDIEDMLDAFKSFLKVLSFDDGLVESIGFVDDEEEGLLEHPESPELHGDDINAGS